MKKWGMVSMQKINMIRFYAPNITSTMTLPETESGHCCRVLRMKEGNEIHVVDGKGVSYVCRILDANVKATRLEIISKIVERKHWNNSITLVIAPTKNIDRIEWLIEKAVEIGIDRIIFIKCEHSERKDVKLERIEKIALSAMKQSMKATMPEILPMMKFNEFIKNVPTGQKFMGYCSPDFPKKLLFNEYQPTEDITILIGPEGDFSPAEVKMAISAGFVPSTFGNTRLRTETAAIYALSGIQTLNSLSNE